MLFTCLFCVKTGIGKLYTLLDSAEVDCLLSFNSHESNRRNISVFCNGNNELQQMVYKREPCVKDTQSPTKRKHSPN